jgi:hypothetical protein
MEAGKLLPGDGICFPSSDFALLRLYFAAWENFAVQALSAIKYHEEQNALVKQKVKAWVAATRAEIEKKKKE